MVAAFDRLGWVKFPSEPCVLNWAGAALEPARAAVADPANQHWLDCGGTWFVGVDALLNDGDGAVATSGPVRGAAVDFLTARYGAMPRLHRAQLSVTYPGYPRPRRGESDAGFRYRRNRDAAHVDGLLPEGADRRRFLREPHAWILGLPLTRATARAAPLVVWNGSHKIMHATFRKAFGAVDPDRWSDLDITDIYQSARREVFDTCARVPVPVQPGEALVLHRLCLHGVAPWDADATAGPEGRMIAYFRPELEHIRDWLSNG